MQEKTHFFSAPWYEYCASVVHSQCINWFFVPLGWNGYITVWQGCSRSIDVAVCSRWPISGYWQTWWETIILALISSFIWSPCKRHHCCLQIPYKHLTAQSTRRNDVALQHMKTKFHHCDSNFSYFKQPIFQLLQLFPNLTTSTWKIQRTPSCKTRSLDNVRTSGHDSSTIVSDTTVQIIILSWTWKLLMISSFSTRQSQTIKETCYKDISHPGSWMSTRPALTLEPLTII